MKRYCHIFLALTLAVASCDLLEEPGMMPSYAPEGQRVQIDFSVAVPDGGPQTKAMGNIPTIDPDGFYVAVFGGSGYFNEWVQATVTSATANYDGTGSTKYNLSASLSVSDSRLRVHFIANCPTAIRTNPPISGSQDTEENIMSKIRSKLTETYNDGYWQKILLPNGIKAEKEVLNEGQDNETVIWHPSEGTLAQFPDPIVMVRNFARVYLRNLTPTYNVDGEEFQMVTIKKFGLAYAPSEGPIAPILSAPYTSDASGRPVTVDEEGTDTFYYENFFINYQNYPIDSDDPSVTLLSSEPFNYGGYSPSDQAYDYYPNNTDKGSPLEADLKDWDNEHPENNILFVYERTIPSAARRATRMIIKAERRDENGSEGDKFYALDIVNTEGVSIPLLRNQTYTVHLLSIEADSGESDISKAASATSATVTGDPNFQSLISISDGKSSIGTSYTEKFFVQPQLDSVMFRYIPTNIEETVNEVAYTANKEYLDLVSIDVGSLDASTGVFTPVSPADAASQGNLSFAVENGEYKVWVVVDAGDKVIPYVRANNKWIPATQAQIDNTEIEKWGMIKYQLNESYKDGDDYFTQERSQTIHILGSFNGREMSRNVVIKTSPRQNMSVTCLQKYVMQSAGETEVVRILIPAGLSRSVFPLEFDIEPDGYSLTPDGDALPVAYGTSIIPGNEKPSFYFVKSLTEDDYKALPTTLVSGQTWKVFDCHFKTTISQNACTVWVYNRYFNDSNSNDDFFNFTRRTFDNLSLATTVYRNANATMTFVLDYDHRNNTVVWWDPNNTLAQSGSAEEAQNKGLSTSNRVLPPQMTVELIGLTPQYEEDGETPVTRNLQHSSGNKYIYYVGTGTPTSDMASVTLALTATGPVGSTAIVNLSTENITENPNLYVPASVSTTIRGPEFTNLTFSPSTLALGLNQTTTFSFTYAEGLVVPIIIYFDGLTLNGSDSRMTDNGDGTWTFTPTSTDTRTYSISLKSTTRFTAGTVTLEQEDYSTANATVNRSTSFTIPASAIYIRGTGTGDPTNFTTGNSGTYVYLNYTTAYSYVARSRYSSSYLNSSSQTVSLSNFTITNDDSTVYFIYRYGNRNYTYYYATSTLSELLDATSSNRVTLHFSTTQP